MSAHLCPLLSIKIRTGVLPALSYFSEILRHCVSEELFMYVFPNKSAVPGHEPTHDCYFTARISYSSWLSIYLLQVQIVLNVDCLKS